MSEAMWGSRTWSPPLADPAYRQEVWGRLTANVVISERGCWLWQKHRSVDGYGVISVKRRMTGAHQVSLAITRNGMWDLGLQVDHLCAQRACCNPEHLELVTPQENSLRGYGRNVAAALKASKTVCKNGHPFDEQNTYVLPVKGHRACRACRAACERRRKAA